MRDPGRRLLFPPLFGDADAVAQALNASMAKVRTTHLALGVLPGMDPAVTRRSMERFISEAAPLLG
ncbi:MAG: hypothetical protein O3C27_02405 [Actinomycetota bacterium]|nr:hypothetical protein [Actinomycetota bacterium]